MVIFLTFLVNFIMLKDDESTFQRTFMNKPKSAILLTKNHSLT